MSDPRHPASSSSNSIAAVRRTSSSQRPDEASDLSWLDFLRTVGGTVPDTSETADRKRRRAGTSPERRNYPYPAPNMSSGTAYRRPSQIQIHNIQRPEGSSLQTAIDLVTPSRIRSTVMNGEDSRRSSAGSGVPPRRESDVTLPTWQPDSQVSQCPVCRTDFGFWYRKHHCRKCGRVVCSSCSPHRITIPRHYIVQPPNPFESEFMPSELTSPRPSDAALGGGEVVRVCNPCVPDPWTPDTIASRPSEPTDIPPRPLIEGARNVRSGEIRTIGDRYERYGQRLAPPPPPPPQHSQPPTGYRSRSQSHQPIAGNSQLPSQSHANPGVAIRNPPFDRPPAPQPPSSSRSFGHRYSHSSAAHPSPLADFRRRPSAFTAPSAPPQPKPRRQVREEDECPVCGLELAPGEQTREAHIQECIAARFSSSTPRNSISQPPAPPPAIPENGAVIEASSSTPPTLPAPPPRPRATSYRPRGMALYRATEKDCSTEDGEPQECVICFEEFQPGDEMGRMECLCKFHRACIRQWWETKGAGSCPTHQLHE